MEQGAAAEELEEYARVLDFLPTGKSSSLRSEPIAQLVGENRFTLLEVVTKTKEINIGERVYIGKGERDKVMQIKARITYEDLTETAKNQLPIEIANIIKQNEPRFVKLFNTAGPISMRLHALELFPGIGKKHLEAIITAREEKEFESFEDISKRVPPLQDPVKLLVARVIEELKGGSRFYILARPYKT
ncbi:MAG: DUF655 domain-containing protein [Candidatus Micrarchaeaceae archaeon]